MKTIQIKSLSLVNFKGIKKLEITDFQTETNIYGANGTGKTSIFDAFTWLLFGKDSYDRTNFEIKTLDKLNNVIPKIDHVVEAVIDLDGEDIKLKRTFREKWVKKRGSLEAEFGGNETLYEWNDVPVTLGEFQIKISSIVEESVFKLITSPTAFNALKWQDQRQVLIDISGGVTDQDVARGNPEFENLLTKIGTKTIPDYEKQIKASIRKSKDEIKMIPSRVDEVERGKPEAIDFADVRRDLAANEKELAFIDNQISDKVAAQQEVLNKRQEIQKEIYSLKSELQLLEHTAKQEAQRQIRNASGTEAKIKTEISEKQSEIDKANRTLIQLKAVLKNEQGDIELLSAKNDHIRKQWTERNAEDFKMNEEECKCPTCEREFPSEDIEEKRIEMEENFRANKQRDLDSLSAKGKTNAQAIESAKAEVEKLNTRISKGEDVLVELQGQLIVLNESLKTEQNNTEVRSESEIVDEIIEKDKAYWSKKTKIGELEEDLKNEKGIDIEDLKNKKAQYTEEISKVKSRLLMEDQIKNANTRIDSLQKEESQLAQQIADYEMDQFVIENFTKAKIETLENLINKRFEFVNFKLFELQVNGGEVPTCKALINGVPFSDANTASKINAGVDIINTLCDHYEVSAPIFIDNRESVVELIDSKSQIINLIVSKKDKKLRVEAAEMVEMF